MTAISKGNGDVIAKLTPGGDLGLAHLSDDELLANTRRLVGKTNELLAALLAHLAEVEARGIHRTRRCARFQSISDGQGSSTVIGSMLAPIHFGRTF